MTPAEELERIRRFVESGMPGRWLLERENFRGMLATPEVLDQMSSAVMRAGRTGRELVHLEMVVQPSVPWNGSFVICAKGKSPEGLAYLEAEVDRYAAAGVPVYDVRPQKALLRR